MPTHQPPVLLVIDDDQDLALVLKAALEAAGYAMVHAPDSLSALVWLAAHTPALVLLDLWIPVDGGRRLAQAIHKLPGSTVPLLMMTAEHLSAEAVTTLGAVSYLRKPFDLDDLLAAVERVVPVAYGEDPTAA